MDKPIAAQERYLSAVAGLGEMVVSRQPEGPTLERLALLCGDGAEPGALPALGILCGTLGLEPPEALCAALWVYHEASPAPPLTAQDLLEHYRRLAGRAPGYAFKRLFASDGQRAALHPIAADFLLNRPPRLPDGVQILPPEAGSPPPGTSELFAELSRFLARCLDAPDAPPALIALSGEPGSGRGTLFSRLADEAGLGLMRVDLSKKPEKEDVLLAGAIHGCLLCLDNVSAERDILPFVGRTGIVLAALEPGEPPLGGTAYVTLARTMPELTPEERRGLFEELTAGLLPPGADASRVIAATRMNPGQLKGFAARLKAESMAADGTVPVQAFDRLLRDFHQPRIPGAARLDGHGSLDDLILPPEQLRQLRELCSFAASRVTVYKEWGLAEKFPWGRGLSALFYGAPGTGKTLAAALLAKETGLPLMQIDISQLFSKYIGETQKNIGKIFDQAGQSDCILFFDEADALFTRRGEASDAQDKYANAETAYLLQRMERYDGVCVLATNLLQNFDEAFRRRIGYMLHFPMPDEGMRERIWRGIFPAKAPVGDLDYALLARHLELSGASIKNCAVHAAYLAAVSQTGIGMKDILAGARNEYAKLGKTLNPQVFQLIREDA